MKKTIDNALNEINDKYIEEAANASRLQNTTARTVRNIAIPVASAAAVAGICFGMGRLGIFGSNGVDLLPSSSTTGSGSADTSSIIAGDEINVSSYWIDLPDEIPLAQITTTDVEEIIFGSQFPEMIYASEDKAIFTEGVGGIYIYDFEEQAVTDAVSVRSSLKLAFDSIHDGEQLTYTSFYPWDSTHIQCSADGEEIIVSVSYYNSNMTIYGSGQPMSENYMTEYYTVDLENLTLTAAPWFELTDYNLYNGLFEIDAATHHSMSMYGARIGDTDEYVFIRNCTADIDLIPAYNMQYIELRRCSEGDALEEALDGGYYPFDDAVGKNVPLYYNYQSTDGNEALLIAGGFSLQSPVNSADSVICYGASTIYGDLLSLEENSTGYRWLYRIEENSLLPLEAIGTQPTKEELAKVNPTYTKQTEIGDVVLYAATEELSSERLEEAYDTVQARIDQYRQEREEILSNGGEINEERLYEIELQLAEYQKHLIIILEQMELQKQYELIRLLKLEQAAINNKLTDDNTEDYQSTLTQLENDISEYTDRLNAIRNKMELYGYEIEEAEVNDDPYQPNAETEDIISSAILAASKNGYEGSADISDMMWCVPQEYNWVTSYFGYDDWRGGAHFGIDITGVGIGSAAIFAAQDGKVILTSNDGVLPEGLGKCVVIDHGNGYSTLYAHCERITVATGDIVEKGEQIGNVGSTGWSTGYHVHFGVYKDGVAVNPLNCSTFDGINTGEFNPLLLAVGEALEGITQPKVPDSIYMPIGGQKVDSESVDNSSNDMLYVSEANSDVFAADSGEIIFSGFVSESNDVYIAIKHDGYVTLYGQLGDCKYSEGDYVQAGEIIGNAGEDGTMLFGMRVNSDAFINNGYTGTFLPAYDTPVSDYTDNLDAVFDNVAEAEPLSWIVGGDNGGLISELTEADGGYIGHQGVDIDAPAGTPVLAADDGTVIFADWEGDYGYCVKIQHDDMITVYGHLSEITVKQGDFVSAGQPVAAVGSTGRSTHEHLHFELIINGTKANPMYYLPEHQFTDDCVRN